MKRDGQHLEPAVKRQRQDMPGHAGGMMPDTLGGNTHGVGGMHAGHSTMSGIQAPTLTCNLGGGGNSSMAASAPNGMNSSFHNMNPAANTSMPIPDDVHMRPQQHGYETSGIGFSQFMGMRMHNVI